MAGRRGLVVLVAIGLALAGAGCDEAADEAPKAPAATDRAIIDPNSPVAGMACKVNRGTVQKVVAAYFAQRRRMPRDVAELEAQGVFDKRLFCPGGGTYSFDAQGRVSCSVHGGP